jgi:hypothetical protein
MFVTNIACRDGGFFDDAFRLGKVVRNHPVEGHLANLDRRCNFLTPDRTSKDPGG